MRRNASRLAAALGLSLAAPLFAGFGSTETFLPAVGRVPGQGGAQFYTTVWASNLTGAPQTLTFEFLEQGQANPSPAKFTDNLAPGETRVYENVVESRLGLSNAIGAARVTSTGELFVSERIYNQAPGADIGDTEGLFFAGVPKGFSISAGQSASIQGINQGGAENFRYNFALIETGGGSPTVNVQVFDGSGTMLGQKSYGLLPYEQIQPNVADVVPNVATTNARITATVTSGTGSALLAGAQLANESQDSSGFEMTFRDDLLGGGGTAGVTSLNGLTGLLTLTPGSGISITPSGSSIAIAYTGGGSSGLTSVAHDASLSGDGTGASPLAIANGQVVHSINGLHDNLTLAAGANVTITPSGSTLTIAASGGGLTLPFSGSTSANTALSVTNSNTTTGSTGILGEGNIGVFGGGTVGGVIGTVPQARSFKFFTGTGVEGISDTFGVFGYSGDVSGYGAGSAGVWGDSNGSPGVIGTSGSQVGVYAHSNSNIALQAVGVSGDGVYGTSASSNGVEGNVGNASAGVAGVNTGTGPGVYGENQSGGYAGDFFGDVIVGGNITYSGSLIHSSDARFKKNVAGIADALDGVLRLRGVTFEWRRDEFPRRGFPAGRSVGFIAQEVESRFPSLVSTDGNGYKGVDYAALAPILVEAIKAQQRTIEDLTRRIQLLEGSARPTTVAASSHPSNAAASGTPEPGTGGRETPRRP